MEHKTKAFTNTNKHKSFYSKVVCQSWNAFTLRIVDFTPDHINLFAVLNPNYVLNKKEYNLLINLTLF